jgi:two-component system, NarL family, sensor kinase
MTMKRLIFIILILSGTSIFAQHPTVDSLGKIAKSWAMKKPSFGRDTSFILAFTDYLVYCNYFKEKNTKQLLDSLERFTNRTKWKAGKGLFMFCKTNYTTNFEQNSKGKLLDLATKTYDIVKDEPNPRAKFYANYRLATILLWNATGNDRLKQEGLNYAQNAVKIAKSMKDTTLICQSLAYLANHLAGFNKMQEELVVLLEGEALLNNAKVDYFGENLIYGTLAGFYSTLGNEQKTVEYIDKTLASGRRENDYYCLSSMSQFKAYLAGTTGKNKNPGKAIELYEESYKYAQKLDEISVLARVEGYLYNAYKQVGNVQKALEYLEKLKKHEDEIAKKDVQKVYADYDISSKELKIKELENEQLSKEKALKILENQSLLKDRDAKIKELNFLKLLKINGDSLSAQKEQKLNADILIKGKENKIKSLENFQLKAENEKKNNERNILIASILAGIGLITYVLFTNRNLKNKNQELENKNREIEESLLKGTLQERKRVASELHDNLSAKISGIKWRLEAIKPVFEIEKHQNIYTSSINALAEVYTDVRLISHNLLPAELETKGISFALNNLVKEINGLEKTQFNLNIPETENRYKSKIEYELFNIILELSNNILKHSKAQKAEISLEKLDNILQLKVTDNGIGFNELENKKGMGFANLKSRVDSLNGKMLVENVGGVKVEIVVPV